MAATFTANLGQVPNAIDHTQQQFCVDGVVVFTGNYPDGGDTLDLGGICPSNLLPNLVQIVESPPAGTDPTGYVFVYCPGTTVHNGQLWIGQGASVAPSAEIPVAAYPAALTTGPPVIKVRAWFPAFGS